jgi:adenosylcobinamide kinase/adenosylcobinamide-phosphate guanylyltransferase
MGIIPAYPLGRVYRDILGRANARLARAADATLLMVAGMPVEVSALASVWEGRRRELFPSAGD